MGKRVRLAPSSSKHKLVDKKDKSTDDGISQLPDEVLVSILSLLTFKEAARTSVLSHRWERLWISYNGSLDFDATETLDSLTSNSLEKERSKYVSWVNQVLVSLGGGSSIHLDDFRVRFDLNICYSCHIDRWIKFALEEKRVQRLELNLKPFLGGFTDASDRYNFPLECYDRIKQPCGLYNLTSLTSLRLKFVNVSGELIEHFLSNCPLLEQLSVEGAEQLLNLKVIGATLKLKYLEIRACLCLEIVEISAPNLVSLIYYGKSIMLHVENVPQLAEVSIGGRYHHPLTPLFRCLSNHFSQLETLKLDIHNTENKEFMRYLELSKLKHLILCITVFFGQSLLDWTSLIEASPSLHKFTLELASISSSTGRKLQTGTKCPHQCLKVVELVGFVGCSTDVEFAMYLLENAMALEEIIIECKRVNESDKNAAKRRALQLKRNLPKGVNLVVI